MWKLLLSLGRRPAPPGSVRGRRRMDGPPHGWVPANPSPAERAAQKLDGLMLDRVTSIARGTTRRQVIQRVAAFGLAAGLAGTRVLWSPRYAYGYPTLDCYATDPSGVADGPCGPHPICDDSFCNDSGNCDDGHTAASKRDYGGDFCHNSVQGLDNCWAEICCGTHNRVSLCCDCCVPMQFGGCTSCNQTKHKCICRSKLQDC